MAIISLSGTTLIVSPHAGPGRTKACEPITVGVPLPRGMVDDPRRIGSDVCAQCA